MVNSESITSIMETKTQRFDVAIVGLGALGSAAAYHAVQNGASVIGFEQFEFGHVRGASGDTSRIFRTSYGSPEYVALAQSAYQDWIELEKKTGLQLLTLTGGVIFFPPLSRDDIGTASDFAKSLDSFGIPYEVLDSEQMKKRWPQFSVPKGVQTVYTADSGILHATRSVTAMQYHARQQGALLKENTKVERLMPNTDGVTIKTSKGEFRAAKVILTGDAWVNELLTPLGAEIPLSIMQEQVTYFKPADPSAFDPKHFPVWIWASDPGFYGFPAFGEPSIKAARDTSNNMMEPKDRTFVHSAALLDQLTSFLGGLIPGKGQALRSVTCQYAITPERQFVLSPLDKHRNIIVGLGAGHAFKFAPAIGRVLAELAINGHTKEDVSKFGIPKKAPTSKL